ncbi:hypothetical cytosolic protein [Syntrophus aciditrophicus SB]|uniref:Hypothetical cytosolic protein n=1 Tax=Syntrophus aciditrophicus (strain SB) TaxID=56780 RepID=Q2LS29_SYNAS|nr:hypothetical cytosolic protein [Syntrophus aciditrophicus SB]
MITPAIPFHSVQDSFFSLSGIIHMLCPKTTRQDRKEDDVMKINDALTLFQYHQQTY